MEAARGRPGIREIAAKTGFSVKTVSRAINGLGAVRASTRQAILEVAGELAYSPDLHARSLRTRRGHAVGYVIPDIANAFYGVVGIAVERIFRERGYGILVTFTGESAEQEEGALRQLVAQRVAGLLLASVGTTAPFIRKVVLGERVPVVAIDNAVVGLQTTLVLHDNVAGAAALTSHLLEHGHRRVACVSGPLEETSGSERLAGYRSALEAAGIAPGDGLVRIANWRRDGGERATRELLESGAGRPTAVFYANSIMALGGYRALAALGVRVPGDVAVVAYDNLEFVEALNPPLTTLDTPAERIGEIAARILLERIEDGDTASGGTHRVPGRLVRRASCGCA